MGRASSFKKSGGFLNNVDGTITGYVFTDEFNGVPFKAGRNPKTKKENFHSLYMVPSVRLDGADDDVTTTLFGGGFENFEVSEDGHTLTPVEGGYQLGENAALAKFIQSWEKASGEGSQSETVEEGQINFEPIIGSRCRFVQEPYSPEEVADLKRRGKPTTRKSKEGKEYQLTNLVVSEVYELATAETKTNGKAAKPSPVKSAKADAVPARTTSKGAKPAAASASVDIKELATTALVEILKANGNKIAKQKLSIKTLTTPSLKGNENRDNVRKFLFNDDNLEELAAEGATVEGTEYAFSFEKDSGLIEVAEA